MVEDQEKSITLRECNSKLNKYNTFYRVNSVLYSMDSKFILSGSEDTNLRIWKSNASDPLKTLLPREKEKLAYYDKLKKKYKYNKDVKRILRHKHLPKFLVKKNKVKQIQK